jgi:hypothetical protein
VNDDGTVELFVMSVYGGIFFNHSVEQGDGPSQWNWHPGFKQLGRAGKTTIERGSFSFGQRSPGSGCTVRKPGGVQMFGDFIGGFLGALGGLAAGVAALRYLLGKYIELQISKDLAEHKHGLDKQLTTLQSQLSRFSDVLSRRNEREFAVTEKTWELMIEAFGTAQGHFSPGKSVPVLKLRAEADAQKVISKLPFDDEQKEALRRASQDERDELYEQYELTRGYVECHKLWAAFKNYVSTHEIFFAQDIFEKFTEIRNDLYGVIVHVEMFVGPDGEDFDTPEKIKVNKDLRAIDEKVKTLTVLIRERFGFSEK